MAKRKVQNDTTLTRHCQKLVRRVTGGLLVEGAMYNRMTDSLRRGVVAWITGEWPKLADDLSDYEKRPVNAAGVLEPRFYDMLAKVSGVDRESVKRVILAALYMPEPEGPADSRDAKIAAAFAGGDRFFDRVSEAQLAEASRLGKAARAREERGKKSDLPPYVADVLDTMFGKDWEVESIIGDEIAIKHGPREHNGFDLKKPHKGMVMNWRYVGDRIAGNFMDHPNFEAGERLRTSPVLRHHGNQIETRNSRYTLGTPA